MQRWEAVRFDLLICTNMCNPSTSIMYNALLACGERPVYLYCTCLKCVAEHGPWLS